MRRHLQRLLCRLRRGHDGWLTQPLDDHIHVLPLGDLIEHDLSDECICGPAAELVQTESGDQWLIAHESLDRREDFE